MSDFYEVITIADGKRTVERVPVSPEMRKLFDAGAAWWREHGCKCSPADPGDAVVAMRGHSCDVSCRKCGGWRQIG